MKICVLLLMLYICVTSAYAQTDSATVYIHGLPVSEDDTAEHNSLKDIPPLNKDIIVPFNQLPRKVQQALKEPEYKGWNDFPIQYRRTTGIYTIRFISKGDTTVIGLNENGKPVKFGENSIDDQ